MPNDYVFPDANTLIYFGKSQLILGNPTLVELGDVDCSGCY